MNRTGILLLLFIVLGAGAFIMLNNQDTLSTTSHREDGNFAVENIDDVYKIFIADREDYRVLLERKKDHWVYNKKYKVRPTQINDVLGVIKRVEMKYTTPRGAEKNMQRNLATTGIKVEILGKNDEKIKTYYVGGATANSLGTYMIMEGSSEPYVVHDPMMQGMLRGKFLKQPDDWKDLMIFGETVDEIQSVSVAYPKQRNKSFKIERSGNDFSIKPFYEATPVINKPMLKGAVEKYLTGYSVIQAEAFSNTAPGRDSITSTIPFVTLSLTNTDGETKTANYYPIVRKDKFGNPLNFIDKEMKSSASIGRYYVDYSDGSFRLFQHRVSERLFWSYDHFFKP